MLDVRMFDVRKGGMKINPFFVEYSHRGGIFRGVKELEASALGSSRKHPRALSSTKTP